MDNLFVFAGIAFLVLIFSAIIVGLILKKKQSEKEVERGLSLVPMVIYLPPMTEDIDGGGRDNRDVFNEAISQAQVMYSILASTIGNEKGVNMMGGEHVSFEITAHGGVIKYFVFVPEKQIGVVRQAIMSAYPTARVEETERENIFSQVGKINGVSGAEFELKKEYIYPINSYNELNRDASVAILNALGSAKSEDGISVQILCRPAGEGWIKKSTDRIKNLRSGTKKESHSDGSWWVDAMGALVRPPETHEKSETVRELTEMERGEIEAIEGKTRYPAFEVCIRVIASSNNEMTAEALVGGVVAAFSQFDSPLNNGFKVKIVKDKKRFVQDYILRRFQINKKNIILNSVELASIFHLPQQNAIPTSQVERQTFKEVEGPAKIASDGVVLGVNEFRGEKKEIRLSENDRRRHTYVIGATGMGKSVLLKNIAYQDMMAGRGFAFIDPHGDTVEDLLAMIPPERVDDVIYFNPSDLENPIGMNMFEFSTEEQKDLIIQEGINMLYSLYDPGHTGIFGPRGEHMFRNAALLLMSDPRGTTFIDIPKVFVDPELVREKLKYVTDKSVYDYWTKEFPQSQKSNDAGEVATWFASKWGPFLSNTMMRNILGQTKSGFNLREIMDNKKIFLVNLSKGKMGEMNSRLLGMILVMKFQMAAMSRADIPEEQRNDFCLFVDEFQNFSTESFESILSEARKFRLNLIVANQFLTQLTDKIREGILGNVGTIISGRLGVTDAEMLQKAFQPTFSAEDLHRIPNHHAITTVMMFDMPSTPFTMTLLPQMGEKNIQVLEGLKKYVAMKYGKARDKVESEINERQTIRKMRPEATGGSRSDDRSGDGSGGGFGQKIAHGTSQAARNNDFLGGWNEKKSQIPLEK